MLETGDRRIRLDIDDHVAVLKVDRPEKLNALDYDMVLALERAAHLIETAPQVRAAIITGAGEKSFCAGGDIEAWSAWSPQDFGMAWVRHGHRAFDALARLRQPLVAVLNGHTLGGGLELAATADYRIAEEHVKLGQPENRARCHSRLVRHPAQRAPLRFADRAAHGAVRGNLHG